MPKAPDVPRILANALFAAQFVKWKRAPPSVSDLEVFEGDVDNDLVNMIDGAIFHYKGKDFSFEPGDVKDWFVSVTRFEAQGREGFEAAASNRRTGTVIRLGPDGARFAYGLALDACAEKASA